MAKRISDRYMDSLLRTVWKPSLELEMLKHCWPAVQQEFDKKRRRLDRMIPKNDPLRLPVDLLSPLNKRDDETLHTRALAYLLDPLNGHGFGNAVLGALLQNVKQNVKQDASRRSEAAQILQALTCKGTNISVMPEYRYRVEGAPEKSAARADVWVEIRAGSEAGLIVIENKINARESSGQLGWYERKAGEWGRGQPGRAVSLLIFIAPEQHKVESSDTDEWVVLSYVELAAALRTVWKCKRRAVGRSWLGLYIASITRGLLRLEISSAEGTELTQIQTYVGEAQ